MPRRSILSAAERDSLLALPATQDELIRHYTLSETDLSIIRLHRKPANRLGFAVQLCYMRHPGLAGANEWRCCINPRDGAPSPWPPIFRRSGRSSGVRAQSCG
ncbi:transposase Tn3 (plasmid) [Polaromonas naphthalenivorans CJ2]|uniref:Transposase Tn3 n=1 Tax=Polaromonas naphthalenivorans (strain CJ2) TaxID=365044 RepID=A1VUT5_POLNA|nr:transposase Tn3 [Polaromonas naphthalenivorans CJ2]